MLIQSGSGPQGIDVEDEGIAQGRILTLDIVGDGASIAVIGDEATLTVPGDTGTDILETQVFN